MRRCIMIVAGTLGWWSLAAVSAQGPSSVSAVVETYCVSCHNGRLKSPSGILLDKFDTTHIAADPERWARAYRQLQAGAMPPAGSRRPDRLTIAAVLTSIEEALGTKPPPAASSNEVATRLATILWNSAPDAVLLKEARSNRLRSPTAVERQVQRMLADDRAQAFVR